MHDTGHSTTRGWTSRVGGLLADRDRCWRVGQSLISSLRKCLGREGATTGRGEAKVKVCRDAEVVAVVVVVSSSRGECR